jgi:hypothetical protein
LVNQNPVEFPIFVKFIECFHHKEHKDFIEIFIKWAEMKWKQKVGYHRQSLAPTQMYGLKTIFGERVSGREFASQATQMLLRCAALDRMTHLGMPDRLCNVNGFQVSLCGRLFPFLFMQQSHSKLSYRGAFSR